MARATIRDKIWTIALIETARKKTSTSVDDVAEKVDASEQTIRDTLNTIAKNGFIMRKVREDGTVRYAPTDSVDETKLPFYKDEDEWDVEVSANE